MTLSKASKFCSISAKLFIEGKVKNSAMRGPFLSLFFKVEFIFFMIVSSLLKTKKIRVLCCFHIFMYLSC